MGCIIRIGFDVMKGALAGGLVDWICYISSDPFQKMEKCGEEVCSLIGRKHNISTLAGSMFLEEAPSMSTRNHTQS